MFIPFLAVYLGLTAFNSAHADFKIIEQKCSQCHVAFSSEEKFNDSHYFKTKRGRNYFIKSLNWMPPLNHLGNEEKVEITHWLEKKVKNKTEKVRRPLTPTEIAQRCINIFTNASDLLEMKITSEEKAIESCNKYIKLKRSKKEVLTNLFTFFESKQTAINLSFNNQDWGSIELYDKSQYSMGLIYTLIKNLSIEEIFKKDSTFESTRLNSGPPEYLITTQGEDLKYSHKNIRWFSGEHEDKKKKLAKIKFVNRGKLTGVLKKTKFDKIKVGCYGTSIAKCEAVDQDFERSLGAGVLGSIPYFIGKKNIPLGLLPDGESRAYRRWSSSVLKDFLCRDLPVAPVKITDDYLDKSSKINFNKTSSCMNCHATMDNLALVVDNYKFVQNNMFSPGLDLTDEEDLSEEVLIQFMYPVKAKKHESEAMLVYKSKTTNKIYNRDIDSLEDFAGFLTKENDFYYCQASKVVEFITGRQLGLVQLQNSEFNDIILKFTKHKKLQTLMSDLIKTKSFKTL